MPSRTWSISDNGIFSVNYIIIIVEMIAACSIITHSFDTICVEELIHGSIQAGNCYHPPQILGLPRCKNLWIFSLFRGYCLCALYCFGALCCLARSLVYVTGEFHRFLHQGWVQIFDRKFSTMCCDKCMICSQKWVIK